MTGSELQLAPPVTAVSSRRGAAPAQVGGRERQAACHAVVATATFACSTAASSALCSPATCTGAAWTPSVPSVTEQVKATLPNGSRGMPLTLRGRARLGACQWGQRENGAQRQQGLERRHAAVLELLACARAPACSLRLKMYSETRRKHRLKGCCAGVTDVWLAAIAKCGSASVGHNGVHRAIHRGNGLLPGLQASWLLNDDLRHEAR